MDRVKLSKIASNLKISTRTLRRNFDKIITKQNQSNHFHKKLVVKKTHPVNLVLDATYFGRKYGFFCFSDGKNILYFKEIKNEGVKVFRECLNHIENNLGYRFQSFVLDGKRGFINNIKKHYPNRPIQMCHFHQKAIIRRYITDKPQSKCGQELKELMFGLSEQDPQEFIDKFFNLKEKYQYFLRQRNDNDNFKHQALRSAFASIDYHLGYLFTYKEHPNLNIPNTTNNLEGKFSYLKERVGIHRGLRENRKKKAIEFLLKNYQEK